MEASGVLFSLVVDDGRLDSSLCCSSVKHPSKHNDWVPRKKVTTLGGKALDHLHGPSEKPCRLCLPHCIHGGNHEISPRFRKRKSRLFPFLVNDNILEEKVGRNTHSVGLLYTTLRDF